MSKTYTVSAELMEAIVNLINTRPYGEVAPLATALAQTISDQQGDVNDDKNEDE